MYDKEPPPPLQPTRPRGGYINRRSVLLMLLGFVILAGGVVALGNIKGTVTRNDDKGLARADMGGLSAPAPDPKPAEAPKTEAPEDAEPKGEVATGTVKDAVIGRRDRDDRPVDHSTLAFGNAFMKPTITPLLTGAAPGGGAGLVAPEQSQGQRAPVGETTPRNGGNGYESAGYMDGGQRSASDAGFDAKQEFYQRGRSTRTPLDHPHSLQGELKGCVVKAGDEFIVQNRNAVRTGLPFRVQGIIVEDVWGQEFLGGGRVRRCLAVPAESRLMVAVNGRTSRGDVRIQMCADRLDIFGGGRMEMGCAPGFGQDGSAGVEADSQYDWGGIAAGILIEAALSAASSLTNLIEGPGGVAVQVGMGAINGVGGQIVRDEFGRGPTLIMERDTIYRIQVQGDISFPTT